MYVPFSLENFLGSHCTWPNEGGGAVVAPDLDFISTAAKKCGDVVQFIAPWLLKRLATPLVAASCYGTVPVRYRTVY